MDLLHCELDRRERVLDLVGESACHLLPRPDALQVLDARAARLNLHHHAVERGREIRDLVLALLRHADVQVAFAHLLRGLGQLTNPRG